MLWLPLLAFCFVGWGLPLLLRPSTVGAAVAPTPLNHQDAVVQVYGADVWGLRGRFAMHTWVATKAPHAASYTIYQVLGWRLWQRKSVVSITRGMPDQPWLGSEPLLLLDKRGREALCLLDAIHQAAQRYPFAKTYTMWPEPNSNSFTQWIALCVPELQLSLPAKALGKNWMRARFAGDQPVCSSGPRLLAADGSGTARSE